MKAPTATIPITAKMFKKVSNIKVLQNVTFLWWKRWELNPCPKKQVMAFLRVKFAKIFIKLT